MNKIYSVITLLLFGLAQAQTPCSDPEATTGSTSCVTFTYTNQDVQYTTVRAADGNIWLQQNLGSEAVATASNDSNGFGDLFQWGRWQDGHEKRTSSTLSVAPSPNNPAGLGLGNPKFIISETTWWNVGSATNKWNAATPADATATNGCDPCKALGESWRLPTEAEWEAVLDSENVTDIASAFSSNLKLTTAGARDSDGELYSVGARGYYWSSTVSASDPNFSKYLYYSNFIINANAGAPRFQGSSIRCIKGQQAAVPQSLIVSVQNNAEAKITTNNGTLQLIASILPENADQSATWAIISGSEFATINATGLVTAIANGTIMVKAVSTVNTTVENTIDIIITNQIIEPTSLDITVNQNAAAQIDTNHGTLQLNAAVLPSQADQSVLWSITSGSEFATVSTTGLVTAIANGTLTVQAVSANDASILDTIDITVTNQFADPVSLVITVENGAPAKITTLGGSLQLIATILPSNANQQAMWTIIDGIGLATINLTTGEVTAVADGIITVQAASAANNNIVSNIKIIITNQKLVSAAPYCDASVEWDVEPISLVKFAGINNATSPEVNITPTYESFIDITGNVTQGETYNLTVEGNTVGLFSHDVRVFIDWDQDEIFDMDSEYYATAIENSTGDDGVQATLDITVPATATVGKTRMRIIKDQWNIYLPGEFDGCTDAYYGQVEDYSLNVTAPVMGVHEANKTNFTVHPNPTEDIITIQSDSEIKSLEAYTITGQLIAQSTTTQLSLGKLASGIYMLKINFVNGSISNQKILKK